MAGGKGWQSCEHALLLKNNNISHVQYRSRGTYTRVKKFTRVISTRHASGVTIFLEFEYSSARVQELECSSGLRVRTFARALAQKNVNRACRWYD